MMTVATVHEGWAEAQRVRYEWAAGRSMPADPQVVGEHINALREAGDASPSAILESARPEDSPIHKLYEWNDAIAAEHYRLEVSREIPKRLVAVVLETPDQEPVVVRPAFVNVPPESGKGQGQYLDPRRLTEDQADRAVRRMLSLLAALEGSTLAVITAVGETEATAELRAAISRVRAVASQL